MLVKYTKFIVILLFFVYSCKGLSVTNAPESIVRDEFGRVVKRISYNKSGKPESVIEVQYSGKTSKPSIKIFKKHQGRKSYPIREEVFVYKKGLVTQINYYIYKNMIRIKAGKIDFIYKNNKPEIIEYYSIIDIANMNMFKYGIDLYTYSDDILIKRRIIEYEHNPKSKNVMQLSQYVIYYKKEKIEFMQTWMLDKKTKKIIKNKEIDLHIIVEMINNIEKNLNKRATGIIYLDKEGTWQVF